VVRCTFSLARAWRRAVGARLARTLGLRKRTANLLVEMKDSKIHTPAPHRPWAVWLGRLLLIPVAAASGGMLYGLYHTLVTGQLITAAKSYGTTSRTINFAESPIWFVVFFALQAAVTAAIILVTIVMGRLFFKRRPRDR
jgi:hypothetical protein